MNINVEIEELVDDRFPEKMRFDGFPRFENEENKGGDFVWMLDDDMFLENALDK